MADMRIMQKIFVSERVGRLAQTALEKYFPNAVFLCVFAPLREITLFSKNIDRAMRHHNVLSSNNNS